MRNASRNSGGQRGPLMRVRPMASGEVQPAGPLRVLVALVGLFRHFREGAAELDRLVFAPNQATATFAIALYTDASTFCSPKELFDGRCAGCVEMPAKIREAAHEVYGRRLIRVHTASFTNSRARIADAWSDSLRVLTRAYDATLVLRTDSVLNVPLDLAALCRPSSSSAAARSAQSVPSPANNPWNWMGYVLCGAHAAALMLSFEADEEDAPMLPDHVPGVALTLVDCPS
jgi:hypothetical protein